ncbi:TraR/DksA C4-type zinc finger protein [Natronospirillum operosum]|uniref:TraR/DksA C4-type zinc finger protein n=1 Tax=Natronospirillum operosum TaxID=2759953 RepID=UPI003B837C2E
MARHRADHNQVGEGESHCLDCGDEIPEKRRLSVRAELCLDCQTRLEKRNRMRK